MQRARPAGLLVAENTLRLDRLLAEISGSDPSKWQIESSLDEFSTCELWLRIRLPVQDGLLELNLLQQYFVDNVHTDGRESKSFASFMPSNEFQPKKQELAGEDATILVGAAWQRYLNHLIHNWKATVSRIKDIIPKTRPNDWCLSAFPNEQLHVFSLSEHRTDCHITLETRGVGANTRICLERDTDGEYFASVAALFPIKRVSGTAPGFLWQSPAPQVARELFLQARSIVLAQFLEKQAPEGSAQ